MVSADYFAGPRPRLFGHRGAAGVAPENTMPSFRRAVESGVDALELDVHATRDGVVVVLHDPTLDRTTDGHGPVRERTFEELRERDAGFHFPGEAFRGRGVRVPALEELLDEFPRTALNIEIKQAEPPIEDAVVSLLERRRAEGRVMLAAEDHAILERIRRRAPLVATSMSYVEAQEFFERCFSGSLEGYAPAARALQIPARFGDVELVTPQTLAAAHAHGLEMHVWTVNDEAEMERLLRLGVDGVMSDFPARLVAVARRTGLRRR
jgi:glycerophosphoryl diester phosphodiesterase